MTKLTVLTEQVDQEQGRYLSWSAVKDWKTCPYYYKLTKIDGIDGFKGNIHTAFGNGVHSTVEIEMDESRTEAVDLSDAFTGLFEKFLSRLPKAEFDKIKEDPRTTKLYEEMKVQGRELVHFMVPALDSYFGEWTLIATEERFYEKCDFYELGDFFFKGFIDLIIQTPDGKYHVIDWKTCSWGWDARKKADPMNTYQLTSYKYFFCKKYGIPEKDVETYFALCKRTNKTDDRVEIVRSTSGPKKMTNTLNLLESAVYNVDHSNHIKNRMSCSKCKFQRTKHCP